MGCVYLVMRNLLLTTILVIIYVVLHGSASYTNSFERQLKSYEVRIQILTDLIAKECPSYIKLRRHLTKDHPVLLEIQMQTADRLEKELDECRQASKTTKRITTKGTTIKMVTTSTTRATTSTIKTTTPSTSTDDCYRAVNYTQSWRRDYKGSDITPGGPHSQMGYACDLHVTSSQWFRFSGSAGTHMLEFCPMEFSCGAYVPYWTDEKMPQIVGTEATVKVFAVYDRNCKYWVREVKVKRCSWNTPNDLIYKQMSNFAHDCTHAFCGSF